MIVRNGQRLGSLLVSHEASREPVGELTETEQEADRQAAEARNSPTEPDRVEAQRPPASGPGSGNDAWRRYAAAVTESPIESWLSLNRDEIIELLDSEGSEGDA